ncbi:hypothetical protein GJR96_11405 [Haloferax sp. MBLA0076]|uniref:Uncharacterized protein n=1 Tax=Haloferax litoreum TaxID=2666140 RepID=A0A6A8GKG1_9EURY|nr:MULTISPECIES: hypothetical protein [Haloferax]KAB1194009.1 hypothetical protein Hfx1148_11360 [Haloferax sp. CBA1148]MRX22557.1 hypothetical protein [Haloferax litoreum]
MRLRAAFFALLVVASVLPVAVGPTTASSPPEPVCGVCSDPFTAAADDAGVDLTIESSELDVQVGDDGVGYWTAFVTVDEQSAATFRENPTLLDSVVRQTFESHRPFVDDPRNLDSRIDGRTVVVTFDVPEMAYRGYGDVLLVDYFNADGDTRYVYVDADRFRVSGPEGTVLVNDPERLHTGDDTKATWIGGERDRTSIDDETYLAFGPDKGISTQTAAYASIAVDSAPYLVSDLVGAALVPTLLMALGVAGIQYATRRFDTRADSVRTLGYLVSGLGVAWMLGLVALGVFAGGLSAIAWTLGLQFVVIGLVGVRRPDWLTFWRLVAATVGPPLVVASAVSLFTRTGQLWGIPSALSLGTTVALFLPLGYAARRKIDARPLALAIVAAPVVFTIPTLPIGGFGPAFMAMLLVGWTLLTLAAGILVYRLGWALGGETTGESPPKSSGSHPQNHRA